MKKESLIAIGLGLLFGFFFSAVILQTGKKPPKGTVIKNLNQPTTFTSPHKTNLSLVTLNINLPQDNLITNSPKIKIQGEAPKNSLIIVQTVNDEKIFENKKTKFELDLSLNYGANQISIFAYPKNIQTPLFKKLTIYYLENKL